MLIYRQTGLAATRHRYGRLLLGLHKISKRLEEGLRESVLSSFPLDDINEDVSNIKIIRRKSHKKR